MERINIKEIDEFSVIEVFGHPCIYTVERVDFGSVPAVIYMYEVRETYGGSDIAASIERNVGVNFKGTIFSKVPLMEENENCREFTLLEENHALYPLEWNDEGDFVTLEEYMSVTFKARSEDKEGSYLVIQTDCKDMTYYKYSSYEDALSHMKRQFDAMKEEAPYDVPATYMNDHEAVFQSEGQRHMWLIIDVDAITVNDAV